jgi:hypothetical protein
VKKPSIAALFLAACPFFGLCFSVPLFDRLTPRVLGIPFNMFWMAAWIVITPGLLSIAYRIERRR